VGGGGFWEKKKWNTTLSGPQKPTKKKKKSPTETIRRNFNEDLANKWERKTLNKKDNSSGEEVECGRDLLRMERHNRHRSFCCEAEKKKIEKQSLQKWVKKGVLRFFRRRVGSTGGGRYGGKKAPEKTTGDRVALERWGLGGGGTSQGRGGHGKKNYFQKANSKKPNRNSQISTNKFPESIKEPTEKTNNKGGFSGVLGSQMVMGGGHVTWGGWWWGLAYFVSDT